MSRSLENRCYLCRNQKVCRYYNDMRILLGNFDEGLVFNGISTTDKPKEELINLLARWCYYFEAY